MKQQKIYTASFPCGSGKTYSAINEAIRLSKQRMRVVIAQPTCELLNQTGLEIESTGGSCLKIYDMEKVGQKLQHQLSSAAAGSIILCSHAALLACSHVPPDMNWHLFVDESPEITYCEKIPVEEIHKMEFLNLLNLQNGSANFKELKPNSLINKIYANQKNDVYWQTPKLQKLVAKIVSPNWHVYCNVNEHKNLSDNKTDWIRVYGYLQRNIFDGFASVTILAAGLEQSLMHLIWKADGADFSRHNTIKPRYETHANSHLLTINYVIHKNFSKYARRKETIFKSGGKNLTLEEVMPYLVKERYTNSSEYLWVANRDIKDDYLPGIRISSVSHGLNQYQHIHKIAFLSALNTSPEYTNFLAEITKISSEKIYEAITLASAYQNIMRTSLRNPACSIEVDSITPDSRCASLLKKYFFPKARIRNLTEIDLMKKQEEKNDRNQGNNEKCPDSLEVFSLLKKTGQINESLSQIDTTPVKLTSQPNMPKNNLTSKNIHLNQILKLDIESNNKFHLTRFNWTYAKNKEEIPGINPQPRNRITKGTGDYTFQELIDLLKSEHNETIVKKGRRHLWSAAYYGAGATRSLANALAANLLILDFDDGNITPQELARILPFKMLATNTYTSSAAKQKWRAYIPMVRYITPETYRFILERIDDSLAPGRMDDSSFSIAQAFYAPCQPAIDTHLAFFEVFDGELFDPIKFIENLSEKPTAITQPQTQTTKNYSSLKTPVQIRIEYAEIDCKNSPDHFRARQRFAGVIGKMFDKKEITTDEAIKIISKMAEHFAKNGNEGYEKYYNDMIWTIK